MIKNADHIRDIIEHKNVDYDQLNIVLDFWIMNKCNLWTRINYSRKTLNKFVKYTICGNSIGELFLIRFGYNKKIIEMLEDKKLIHKNDQIFFINVINTLSTTYQNKDRYLINFLLNYFNNDLLLFNIVDNNKLHLIHRIRKNNLNENTYFIIMYYFHILEHQYKLTNTCLSKNEITKVFTNISKL